MKIYCISGYISKVNIDLMLKCFRKEPTPSFKAAVRKLRKPSQNNWGGMFYSKCLNNSKDYRPGPNISFLILKKQPLLDIPHNDP